MWSRNAPQKWKPIKTLHLTKESFQNKNTSAQSRLGEHGPLTAHIRTKVLNNISIYLRAYKLVLSDFPFNHFLRENPLDEVGEHSLLSFGNLSAMQFAPIELETLADDIL